MFRKPRARWALAAVVVLTIGLIVLSQRDNPEIIVLRPVDAQGTIQNGWTASDAGDSPIDCSFGSASPYDVSGTARWCGASADMGDACWKADDAHVLCLHDPFSDKLSRHPATGLGKPREAPTSEVRPIALLLDDGNQCRARIGGAWASPAEHPDWVGHYSCTNGAIWAPAVKDGKNDAIKKDFWGWSVMAGPYDGHISSHKVTKAYFVGIAGQ